MSIEQARATQAEKAVFLLHQRGMVLLYEFLEDDITAGTVSHLERQDRIVRLSGGLYQLPDAPLEVHHAPAETSKLVPRGVICPVLRLRRLVNVVDRAQ